MPSGRIPARKLGPGRRVRDNAWRTARTGCLPDRGGKAMNRRLGGCLMLLGLGAWPFAARADQFEQLDGPMIVRTLKGPGATARPSLTIADLGAMPPLLRDTRSALV